MLSGSFKTVISTSPKAAAPVAGVVIRRVMLTPKSIEEALVLLVRPDAPARCQNTDIVRPPLVHSCT